MPHQPSRRIVTVEVRWRTLIKLLAVAALVWCLLQLAQTLFVLVVAALLTVTLEPAVLWLEGRRVPRWVGSALILLALLALAGGFVWLTWASLVEQSQLVAERFQRVYADATEALPPSWRERLLASSGKALSATGGYALGFARSAVSALTILFVGFILTFYLLIDGRRVHEWLLAFVPARHRGRAEQTFEEARRVLFGYVAGNGITSVIAGLSTFVVLWWLDVPAALLLAVLAGIANLVPVIGLIISAVPAVLIALAVSAKTALVVGIFYIAYNVVESYLLAPWAYGNRLKLADIAVIVALIVGAELAGVIGALIALPLAALYPTIERLWLRGQLPSQTVPEHQALEDGKQS